MKTVSSLLNVQQFLVVSARARPRPKRSLAFGMRSRNASDSKHSSIRGCHIMPPVPVLKPREVVKTFQKLGWEVARQRGSHIILTKSGHISTLSVPNHPEIAWYIAKLGRPIRPYDGSIFQSVKELNRTANTEHRTAQRPNSELSGFSLTCCI